jgi:hypothetical protein
VDEEASGFVALQEVFQPCARRGDEEGHVEGSINTAVKATDAIRGQFEFAYLSKAGLDRLIGVFGYVFAAVYTWRQKKGAQGLVLINFMKTGNFKVGVPVG